jgi:GT2 family glycosyltransferase
LDICENLLAFIVLHYGEKKITEDCLDSFKGNLKDTYLVINGEDGEVAEHFKSKYALKEVIVLEKNGGYAKGMNEGIIKAINDGYLWIMVLNNDVKLCPNFIEKVTDKIKEIKDEKICFSPLITDKEGKSVWFGRGEFSFFTGRAKHSKIEVDRLNSEKIESDYLTGCTLCFPSSAIKECGLMDEIYFLYWEDVDWSLRLKKSGYKFFVFPQLKIYHCGSASTQLESQSYLYYYFRNHLIFLFKNVPALFLPCSLFFYFLNILRLSLLWLLFHKKEGRNKIGWVFSGIKDFLLKKDGERIFQ